jgi:nucleoid-associated protein YgaU
VDVNQALAQAKDACATVYAADELGDVQGNVDTMNAFVDDKKMGKAKKEAKPIMPMIDSLSQDAQAGRDAAKMEANQSIQAATSALQEAQQAEAATYNAAGYNQAQAKLNEAKQAMSDPCRYKDAKRLADDAARQAANAREAAIAEKRRIEEERRRAEEEARLAALEAQRKEEERLRNMFPPTYTVARGDCLWRISGQERIYDDPGFWPIIHDANAKKIPNPDLIYPGQELTIPRDYTDLEMLDLLYQLWGNY